MENSRAVLDRELALVDEDILSMAAAAEDALLSAAQAFRNGDAALAVRVKEGDRRVDALQTRIEDGAARLLATQSPVAGDLRRLVAAIKLASELERIGDYAVHLAKAASKVDASRWPSQAAVLEEMAGTGKEMLRRSVAAFISRAPDAARACAALDERLDGLRRALVLASLDAMRLDPTLLDEGVRLVRLSGYLERVGDHARSVCELVIFAVEGKREELNA